MSEDNRYVVHQVPQAVIDHVPADIKELVDLRPIEMLPVPKDSGTIFFSNPGHDSDWIYRMMRQTGKPNLAHRTMQSVLNQVTLSHMALGHGDRTLYGEFPHPEPIEFGEVYFPTVHLDPWAIHGHLGETQSWFDRWMGGFSVGYYGFGSNRLRDKREWLGDSRLHHTELLSSFDSYRRGVLRVRIPARRYAGLNAYELPKLFYLEEKKSLDTYALWIVEHLTHPEIYYGRRFSRLWELIEAGIAESFPIIKKAPVKMSNRPRIRR